MGRGISSGKAFPLSIPRNQGGDPGKRRGILGINSTKSGRKDCSCGTYFLCFSVYSDNEEIGWCSSPKRDRRTGRTRLLVSGEFTPVNPEDPAPEQLEQDSTISAINVGAVRGDHSDDHYCMLDSGANVMVIPWKKRNEG